MKQRKADVSSRISPVGELAKTAKLAPIFALAAQIDKLNRLIINKLISAWFLQHYFHNGHVHNLSEESTMRTIAWTAAGCACTLLGLIGLVLPIVPGILFLVLAALCFQRASRSDWSDRPRAASALGDRFERAAAPALRASQRIQLQFWLLARRLLGGAGSQRTARNFKANGRPARAAEPLRTAVKNSGGSRRAARQRSDRYPTVRI